MDRQTKRIYDKISERYHKAIKYAFYNNYLDMPNTLSLLKNVRGKKILDLGCGTGRYAETLKKRGAKVWGMDLSMKMVDIARKEVDGVEFVQGSVYKMPYKSGFFDIVVSGLAVHYFKDLEKAFKEVKRVLKKNGLFIFSTGNPLWEVSRRLKGRTGKYRVFKYDYFDEKKIRVHWPTFKTYMFYYHFTMQTLIRTIIKCGFVIEDYIDMRPINEGKKANKSAYNITSLTPQFCAFKVRKI